MGVLKGDYIGFTFNGTHSSELGIIRVSEGTRYQEELLPSIEDKVVPVPGGDGVYYFGSFYRNKNFNILIAFDSLTEVQFENLRKVFGDRGVHDLIFDEKPYKVYSVKASQPPSLQYLTFEDNSGARIHKGEGTLSFTTMSPFARSRFKFLESYTSTNITEWTTTYGNLNEWKTSSGIISQIKSPGTNYDTYVTDRFHLYNPGHFPTHFILQLSFKGALTISAGMIKINEIITSQLSWSTIHKQGSDWGVQINTKLNLIEGINSSKQITGTLYNKYKTGGNFFLIPTGPSTLMVPQSLGTLTHTPVIKYDYLYF